ncbi:hypothetical protein BPT24_294 [Tenacibaculum phage pT24]|uniref:Uncharacterized protein n=1 Tax=Tenacibaculum phage pT24 TaxID=1880590 RepID=A0A1W7GKR6_9CAUD|nr:hypothetical protein HYP10_gp233 [Tenacibaculum phage pT24]BAX25567.1 hypothetical protein BPT24_294 [Tenacibaculum phage pT24]
MEKIKFNSNNLTLEAFLTKDEIGKGEYNIFVTLKNQKGFYLYLSKETLKTTSNRIIDKIESDMKQKISELSFGAFVPPVNIRGYLDSYDAVLVNRVGGYFGIHEESEKDTTFDYIDEIYVFEDFPHGLNIPFICTNVFEINKNFKLAKRFSQGYLTDSKNPNKFKFLDKLEKYPENLLVSYYVKFYKISYAGGKNKTKFTFTDNVMVEQDNPEKDIKKFISKKYNDVIVRNIQIKLSKVSIYHYDVTFETYPKLTANTYCLTDFKGRPIASVIDVKGDSVLINLIGSDKITRKKIKTNDGIMYINVDSNNRYRLIVGNGLTQFERFE